MAATPITSLLASGLDAFSNLYDVRLTLPGASEIVAPLSIRATNFSPPELTHGSYDVDYKIVQIKRPNASIEGERKFSIEFRMDALYDLYNKLLSWKQNFVDPTNGGSINFGALSGNLDETKYGKVEVVAYKAATNSGDVSSISADTAMGVKWQFQHVLCMKVGSPTFSREGADPITFTADFLFGTYSLSFAS